MIVSNLLQNDNNYRNFVRFVIYLNMYVYELCSILLTVRQYSGLSVILINYRKKGLLYGCKEKNKFKNKKKEN